MLSIIPSGVSARYNVQHKKIHSLLETHIPSIKSAAEDIRDGIECSITVPPTADDPVFTDANYNVHLPLKFHDGLEWLVRVRIIRMDCPDSEMMVLLLRSEAGTMCALQQAGCRVPKAYLPPPQYTGLGQYIPAV